MVKIEDTYAEAFEGLYSRFIITAKDDVRLEKAVYNSTALPSVVVNRAEGGVEQWLRGEKTPDGRKGAIVQFWGRIDKNKLGVSIDRFYKELSYRIRQGIMVVPTTAIFNVLNTEKKIDTMERIGHCGDGYEYEEKLYDRHVIKIPLMMGEFIIERYLGYSKGVMGGNIWFLCETENAALKAGDLAVKAIRMVEGVITPFDICSAGSKPETNYPEIGPTTNHFFCPTLRNKISNSRVPEGVDYIPEIVVNGVSIVAVKEAMRAAIISTKEVDGLIGISAGNYGGRLGKYKIFLRRLFT